MAEVTLETADGCDYGCEHKGFYKSDSHVERGDGGLNPVEIGAGIRPHQNDAGKITADDTEEIKKGGKDRQAAQNSEPRGESEGCGLAGCVVTKRPLGKAVLPPGRNISFERAVPRRPIVFSLFRLSCGSHFSLDSFPRGASAPSTAASGCRPCGPCGLPDAERRATTAKIMARSGIAWLWALRGGAKTRV